MYLTKYDKLKSSASSTLIDANKIIEEYQEMNNIPAAEKKFAKEMIERQYSIVLDDNLLSKIHDKYDKEME